MSDGKWEMADLAVTAAISRRQFQSRRACLLARKRRAGPGRSPDVLDSDPGHGRIAGASAADWGAKVDEVRLRAVRMASRANRRVEDDVAVGTVLAHLEISGAGLPGELPEVPAVAVEIE